MSYQRAVKYNATNTADAALKIKDKMVAMGWTLYDDHSGDSPAYYILTSTGELSNQMIVYIQIKWDSTANYIQVYVWRWWNNSTHSGQAYAYGSSYCDLQADDDGAFLLWVYGNLDCVAFFSKVAGAYDYVYFAYAKPLVDLQTDLTIAPSSGSNITITVTSTAGFVAGGTYQIVSFADGTANSANREPVTISSITNATTMVVASLTSGYLIGSIIGINPQPFLIGNQTSVVGLNRINLSGLGNSTTAMTRMMLGYLSAGDPDQRGGRTALFSQLFYYSSYAHFGYIDFTIFNMSTTGFDSEDTVSSGRLDDGSATSLAATGTDTLTDTGQSWSTNEHAGMTITITQGTGVGQIRKILSNTATVLTLDEDWEFDVGSGALYEISYEGYRFFNISNIGIAVREV